MLRRNTAIIVKSSCAKSAEGSGEEKRMSEYIVRETGYPGTIKQEIVGELVRCKDCKWYEIYQLKQDGTDDRRYKPSYCTLLRHNFTPEWFCADGEVRDDDSD